MSLRKSFLLVASYGLTNSMQSVNGALEGGLVVNVHHGPPTALLTHPPLDPL